jgi:hypothetical protein
LSKGLTTQTAAVISFALSFFLGIIVLGFPLLFSIGTCGLLSYFGFCSTQAVIEGFAIALAIFTVGGTIGGVIAFLIWRAIPTPIQLLLVVFLFVVGLLILQPELDVVALLGLLFTVKGVGPALKVAKK